jgi:hypothetical protein
VMVNIDGAKLHFTLNPFRPRIIPHPSLSLAGRGLEWGSGKNGMK